MVVTRAWVETPIGLLIRITVHAEDGKVHCRMDAGVPAFDADPLTLRALARTLENAAATASDLRAELASGRIDTAPPAPAAVDNPKISPEVTERLGHLMPGSTGRRSVSRRKSA